MVATAHRNGVVALVDGAQSMPHFPINVQDINADFYVMSGHKLFGPTGVGVMYGKKHLLEEMPPWQGGGNMIESVSFEETRYNPPPYKFEAGTGILAGAVGLGAAIDYLERIGFMNASRYEDALLEYGQEKLRAINGVTMIGEAKHKAGVMSFVTKTVTPGEMGEALNQEGIAVRTGHH
jgi:cysteine desulfurase/selenocysteine lyase